MAATIFPTIFIGIGSTGAQILSSLQKHLFEEYQIDDFPAFYLLGLISDDSDKAKANDIYKVDWYHMKIESIENIKNSINNPSLECEKNLKKWLPPSIFDYSTFTDGSGAKRVAGRLHLWDNYEIIRDKIRNAVNIINNSKNEVKKIIKQQNKPEIEVDDYIKVYIFGSLSGGTCSGMCIDTAFLVRTIIEQKLKSVTGIFTIPNYDFAANNKMNFANRNAYAAVTELAYYFYYSKKKKPLEHYLYDKNVSNIQPYDDVYLESCTNSKMISLLKNDKKSYDYESLNEMIGMSLYLECNSETSRIIDGKRVNFFNQFANKQAQFKLPDPETGEPRSFSSFGATSINYPQYSLARAAACDILINKFNEYTIANPNKILPATKKSELIKEKKASLKNYIREKLVSGLESKIDEELEKVASVIRPVSASQIDSILRNYPEKDPFTKRFSDNGSDTEEIFSKVRIIKSDVVNYTRELLSSLKSETDNNISSFKEILDDFKNEIDKASNASDKINTKIKFDELDIYIYKIQEIEDDLFHKLTFTTDISIEKRKEQLIDVYKNLVKNAFEQIRKKASIDIYKEIKDKLFNEVAGTDSIISITNDVTKGINKLITRLEKEKEDIFRQFQDLHHMMFCSKDRLYGNGVENKQLKEWAESEVLNIVNKHTNIYDKTKIYTAFVGKSSSEKASDVEFENKLMSLDGKTTDFNRCCSKMIDEMTKLIIQLNKVNVDFTELFNNINDQGQRNDLEELVKKSYYYIQFDPEKYTKHIKFHMQLRLKLLPKDRFDIKSMNIKEFTIDPSESWEDENKLSTDHFILFYTEESGFAPSHMKVYEEWDKNYKQSFASTNTKELDWTEDEWRKNSIDFKKESRTEFFCFILENINRVFPNNTFIDGDGVPFFSSWSSGKYYFNIPGEKANLSKDNKINLENFENYLDYLNSTSNSYMEAAKPDFNPKIENYLISRLKTCFNTCDSNDFYEKCKNIISDIEEKENSDDYPTDNILRRKQRMNYQWVKVNVEVFKYFIKKAIYKQQLEDYEQKTIINPYDIDPKGEIEGKFDFDYLNMYLNLF